jgi:hypothetical protein
MSFYQKYDLERMLADGPVKTFRAVEIGTGKPVFLHLFGPEGLSMLSSMLRKLMGPSGTPVKPLLETGDFSGSSYAVTEVLPTFSNFRDWLETVSRAPQAPEPSPPKAVEVAPTPSESESDAKSEPGEFTRIFGPMPDLLAKPPKATPPAPAVEETKSEPGEFTLLFGPVPERLPAPPVKPVVAAAPPPLPPTPPLTPPRPAPSAAVVKPSPPPVPVPAPLPNADLPAWPKPGPEPKVIDDFGRMTARTTSPVKGAPKNSWPDAGGSKGDFLENSDLLSPMLSSESIDIESEQARAARSQQPESRPFQGIGEFTSVFGPQTMSKVAPRPEVSTNTSASGLFDSPDQGPSSPGGTKKPKEKQLVADDYAVTTALPKNSIQAAPAPVAQSPAPPIPEPKQDRMMMVIGVAGGAIVVTLLLILVRC